MLLIGMFLSALIFGYLLSDFSQLRLIKVIQGAAVVTMLVNLVALWKQEPRHRRAQEAAPQARFRDALRTLREDRRAMRLLVSVALGTAAFAMQDVLLEPFGAQILGLSVGGTTSLTALLAGGMLIAFAVAARQLNAGFDAYRLSAYGAMIGIIAFAIVTFVGALRSELLFAAGVSLIGFGSGLFAVGTLTATMTQSRKSTHGLALGAWGAVQATAAGIAIGVGGALRDAVSSLAAAGVLGPALKSPATGYAFVYQLEIVLLFATLVAIGPLAATIGRSRPSGSEKLGLADFPGQ
jgi:BCD family chlorophyll transporter-like MFS transporter